MPGIDVPIQDGARIIEIPTSPSKFTLRLLAVFNAAEDGDIVIFAVAVSVDPVMKDALFSGTTTADAFNVEAWFDEMLAVAVTTAGAVRVAGCDMAD
jgi:hypothetical protein